MVATAQTTDRWARLRTSAARPVDGASLAVFRIGFGLMVAWQGFQYLDRGWVDRYYRDVHFTFTYWLFDWVQPLPDPFIALPWVAMIIAGAALAVGFWYRAAAVVAWLTLSYTLLLDKTQYLNHMYLAALLAFLLIWVPADRVWTLRARRSHENTVPAWALAIVAFQVAVPFVYSGVAKLNGDWLRGRPLDDWLAAQTNVPVLGRLFDIDGVALLAAWASMLLDLVAVFFLLNRRTRPWAYLALVAFHMTNARIFDIGIFPWMMIAACTLLLPPAWPRAFAYTCTRGPAHHLWSVMIGGGLGAFIGLTWYESVVPAHVCIGAFAGAVSAFLFINPTAGSDTTSRAAPSRQRSRGRKADPEPSMARGIVVAALLAWAVVQMLVPLRHFVLPGNVHWNEAGHRFSWHMLLRDKNAKLVLLWRPARGGQLEELDLRGVLRPKQLSAMKFQPDMIVQFAHHLEDLAGEDIEIYARSTASLNGRAEQVFIDPDVDLTTISRPFLYPTFVVPLEPG